MSVNGSLSLSLYISHKVVESEYQVESVYDVER